MQINLTDDEAKTVLEVIKSQIQCDLDFIGYRSGEYDAQMRINVKCWKSILRKILKGLKCKK